MAVPVALIETIGSQILAHELSDPHSALRKKFNEMVQEKGSELIEGMFDGLGGSGGSGGSGGLGGSGGSGGSSGSGGFEEDHSQEEADRYKRKGWQVALDNLLPSAATVAETIGNDMAIKRSYLGDALLAMSRADTDPSQMFNGATIARVAGLKAKGDTLNNIMQGTAKGLRDISSDLKRGREQDKAYDAMVMHRPSGEFFDSQRKLSTFAPNPRDTGIPPLNSTPEAPGKPKRPSAADGVTGGLNRGKRK